MSYDALLRKTWKSGDFVVSEAEAALADPAEAVRNLEKILHKHQVQEPEFSRLIAGHSRWYGKPIHQVLREQGR